MVGPTADQRVRVPTLLASWRSLTFLHWPVPADRVRPLLPAGLTVDEHDGAAWLGLAAFVMSRMRPFGLPLLPDLRGRLPARVPAPDLSQAPETNLRTYVRGPDGKDGVWFLSMEIGSAPLAVALRGLIGAPYHSGKLSVTSEPETVAYAGQRRAGAQRYRLLVRPGGPVRGSGPETWLTGRWRLYTHHLGRLLSIPIEHEPWPLRTGECEGLEQNLTDACGLAVTGAPLVHFAERVDRVRVGVPRVVG